MAAVLLSSACTGGDEPSGGTVRETSREKVASALVANVVIPGYLALATSADQLTSAVTALCVASTDPLVLEHARQMWSETALAWARTRAFRLGPAMGLRSMSKIDFPIDRKKIDALLLGTAVDEAAVANLGADQRGLSGVELVLFAPAASSERRCTYARSAASLVAQAAHAVHDGWVTGPSIETKTFVDDSVNGMVFALADVADTQLGKASGKITGTPKFADIDSGPARLALVEMLAMLDSVEVMSSGGQGGTGIAALISSQSNDAAQRLATQLAKARSAVEAIPAPLAETRNTAPVEAAYEAVRVPLVTMRSEIASLLGVTLTLGDADGDS